VNVRPRSRVWVVGPTDGTALEDILSRAGADGRAVAEGRVFIGKRRASPEDTVKPGDSVTFTAPSDLPNPVAILLREDGIVATDKPAALATIPDHGGARGTLLGLVAEALGVDPQKLHPTSRLDRGVSGVVLFAESPEASERLRVARAQGTYARRYVAIASQSPVPPRGEWSTPIGRAKDPRHRAAHGRDPAPALSRYAVVACASNHALLALEPVTGRTHQLRVHASHASTPLLGDRVYGGPHRLTLPSGRVLSLDRIALHAARVRVPRRNGTVLEVVSSPAKELRDWWAALGGEPAAWDAALLDDAIS
jgi:RluA family pseudouridine synthase